MTSQSKEQQLSIPPIQCMSIILQDGASAPWALLHTCACIWTLHICHRGSLKMLVLDLMLTWCLEHPARTVLCLGRAGDKARAAAEMASPAHSLLNSHSFSPRWGLGDQIPCASAIQAHKEQPRVGDYRGPASWDPLQEALHLWLPKPGEDSGRRW